jgi:hypothetical protein
MALGVYAILMIHSLHLKLYASLLSQFYLVAVPSHNTARKLQNEPNGVPLCTRHSSLL